MKNEKEIWLNPVELKQLLEGGLYWKDIETKLSDDGFRRNALKEDVSIDDIIWEPCLNKNPEPRQEERQEQSQESDSIRAILLGEENHKDQLEPDSDQELVKDRQISLNYLLEEKELATIPHAAAEEESDQIEKAPEVEAEALAMYEEDSEVKYEEKDAFSSEDKHFDDDDFIMEIENKGTPFGGLKLVILLIATATITFGVWYYFLSR
ncbi:MAG: hypothetical protein APF84_10785 [Gracilibacter sp. BRH_c7a]|nr:MAG: hypothetical protein APF84_10785 [Gracilibacter sp. BRH_c7a]